MILDTRDFGGIIPRVDAKMLPVNAAQIARNVKLWKGVLAALKAPKLIQALTKAGTIQAIYRLPYSGTNYWLHWASDVDAVRGPVAGDTTKRLYYTGDGEPRVTHAEMASQKTDTIDGSNNYPGGFGESVATDYPRAFYVLGVHRPVTAPVLGTPSGGSGTAESRAYVYTFVSKWGEESAPSPPSSAASGTPNGSWPLSQMDTAPLNTGAINAAAHASGVVTVYTTATNWLRKGHKITVASVVGMTDLNATWTVLDAENYAYTTVSRARTSNVSTLVLTSVIGLAVGQTIVVAGVGHASYNGTWTIASVNSATNTITYANTAANEATTADTAGKVSMSLFKVKLTTAQTYSSDGTWTRKAPYNVTNMVKRIYRVLSGIDGQDYKYVDEIAVATTTYTDTKIAAQLGETLPTQDPRIVDSDWELPPGDMKGIVSLPGGVLAGFRENELCYSEPGVPYAWPPRYRQSMDWPIVGLGVWGSTVTVCTTAIPYRAIGHDPSAVAVERGDLVYPCRAKRSILSMESGVVFASDRGLVFDGFGGTVLITDAFYDREAWQAGVLMDVLFAMDFDGRYYGFWPINANEAGAIVFDPAEKLGALSTNNVMVDGAWTDPETGVAYVVDDEGVKEWDADLAKRQIYEWRGKKHVLRMPEIFTAGKVIADFTQNPAEVAAIQAENNTRTTTNAATIAAIPVGAIKDGTLYGAIGGHAVGAYAVADDILIDLLSVDVEEVQFELYGDGALVYSVAIANNQPFRIAGTGKHTIWEKRLVGNVNIQSAQIAPTMSELSEA